MSWLPTHMQRDEAETEATPSNIGQANLRHQLPHRLRLRIVAYRVREVSIGFAIPGQGVFVGPNLTSDKQTGLGNWTAEQIVAAITEGKRPDGRVLAPVMPSQNFAHLTKSDALAVAAYLKSLPPISNKVPGPFGPGETPTSLVMSVQPGDVYAKLPQPK